MSIYYNPEEFGVKLLADIDDPDACYSFDMVIVVKHLDTGKLYAAGDSGCSCPTPFEDIRSVADMVEVRSIDDVNALLNGAYCDYRVADKANMRRIVRRELAKLATA